MEKEDHRHRKACVCKNWYGVCEHLTNAKKSLALALFMSLNTITMRQFVPKIMLLLVLIAAGTGLRAQTLKISDPVKYNDYIVDQQNLIGAELIKLIGMFDALPEDKQEVIDQLDILVATCKSSTDNVKNLKPIANEFGIKQAAVNLFSFYEVIMNTDYRRMIDEIYAEEPNQEVLQEIVKSVSEKEAKLDADFQENQGKFAKYHNIMLEENELQEEIDGEDSGE
jgi:hypothetical protein